MREGNLSSGMRKGLRDSNTRAKGILDLFNSWAYRASYLLAAIIPILILAVIVWLRPFWGPMDDSVHVLEFVPKLLADGLISTSWEYARNDLSWGMFRPLYPAMAALVYLPGIWLGSTASYLWNACLVFAIIGLYCALLSRILRLPTALILLACASFFYAWDLLQHLSLQEKLVLTFGGLQLWWAWSRPQLSALKFWSIFLLLVLMGFASKASIVIHFSAAIVAFGAANWEKLKKLRIRIELAVLFFLLALQVFLFRQISAGGSYTKQYDFAKVIPNLISPQGLMLEIPLLLCLGMLLIRWREARDNPAILIPAAGVSAFLVLFLPWGIQAYVQSVMAPFFAAMLIQLAEWYLRPIPRFVWVLPLCLFALAVASYRGLTMFGRLSDLGTITRMGPELRNMGIQEVQMPCEEGSGAMQQFWKALSEPTPEAKQWDEKVSSGEYWMIYDRALCPLPGRAEMPADCRGEVFWKGAWPKSYRLVKIDCS